MPVMMYSFNFLNVARVNTGLYAELNKREMEKLKRMSFVPYMDVQWRMKSIETDSRNNFYECISKVPRRKWEIFKSLEKK